MPLNKFLDKSYSEQTNQLFIGTANFNKNYGIGSRSLMFDKDDLSRIFFEIGSKNDIFIDTAQGYSGVEKLIGEIAGQKLDNKIVTKISPNKFDDAKSLIKLVERSLIDLNQNSLYGVLLHDANILRYPNIDNLIQGLEHCIDSGFVSNIGISSYESDQILIAAKKYSRLNIFQINDNILDQRNYNNYELDNLSRSDKKIFLRSVFLQGNLLVPESEIIEHLAPKREVFTAFKEFCKAHNCTPLKMCLDYARSVTWSNGIVVGVSNFKNYLEIVENYWSPVSMSKFPVPTLGSFYSDPRNWIDA